MVTLNPIHILKRKSLSDNAFFYLIHGHFGQKSSYFCIPKIYNPHPKSCQRLILRHQRLLGLTYLFRFFFQGLLISCNQMSADYLFQKDKHYDVCYDTGDKVIQCGRHNDIFKLWLQWRSRVSSVCILFEGRAIYVYFYKILFFVKLTQMGLPSNTNRYRLNCLSLYIFLSF